MIVEGKKNLSLRVSNSSSGLHTLNQNSEEWPPSRLFMGSDNDYVHVVVQFYPCFHLLFSFVLSSLSYITIHKNKG